MLPKARSANRSAPCLLSLKVKLDVA